MKLISTPVRFIIKLVFFFVKDTGEPEPKPKKIKKPKFEILHYNITDPYPNLNEGRRRFKGRYIITGIEPDENLRVTGVHLSFPGDRFWSDGENLQTLNDKIKLVRLNEGDDFRFDVRVDVSPKDRNFRGFAQVKINYEKWKDLKQKT